MFSTHTQTPFLRQIWFPLLMWWLLPRGCIFATKKRGHNLWHTLTKPPKFQVLECWSTILTVTNDAESNPPPAFFQKLITIHFRGKMMLFISLFPLFTVISFLGWEVHLLFLKLASFFKAKWWWRLIYFFLDWIERSCYCFKQLSFQALSGLDKMMMDDTGRPNHEY